MEGMLSTVSHVYPPHRALPCLPPPPEPFARPLETPKTIPTRRSFYTKTRNNFQPRKITGNAGSSLNMNMEREDSRCSESTLYFMRVNAKTEVTTTALTDRQHRQCNSHFSYHKNITVMIGCIDERYVT